jgi:hypothetical protein
MEVVDFWVEKSGIRICNCMSFGLDEGMNFFVWCLENPAKAVDMLGVFILTNYLKFDMCIPCSKQSYFPLNRLERILRLVDDTW